MLMNIGHHDGDLLGDAVFCTCNAVPPASRKRSRHDGPNFPTFPPANTAAVSTVVSQLSHDQRRMYGSAGISTSGKPAAKISPLAQDLVSHLYQQNLEIDALLRLHTERLRSELQKGHCKSLISVMEKLVVKRLSEKEAELESAMRRSADLEEIERRMGAERQIWFDVANKNEAIASSLRTALERRQIPISAAAVPAEEGYGDSGGDGDGDGHSFCFVEAEEIKIAAGTDPAVVRQRRGCCRVCQEEEARVLLLPCRHLCLCIGCESRIDTCPICHSAKKASLEIFVS